MAVIAFLLTQAYPYLVKVYQFSPTRWLWWAALLIGAVGAGLAVLRTNMGSVDPSIHEQVRFIVALTVLAVGICIISATSRWWMSR